MFILSLFSSLILLSSQSMVQQKVLTNNDVSRAATSPILRYYDVELISSPAAPTVENSEIASPVNISNRLQKTPGGLGAQNVLYVTVEMSPTIDPDFVPTNFTILKLTPKANREKGLALLTTIAVGAKEGIFQPPTGEGAPTALASLGYIMIIFPPQYNIENALLKLVYIGSASNVELKEEKTAQDGGAATGGANTAIAAADGPAARIGSAFKITVHSDYFGKELMVNDPRDNIPQVILDHTVTQNFNFDKYIEKETIVARALKRIKEEADKSKCGGMISQCALVSIATMTVCEDLRMHISNICCKKSKKCEPEACLIQYCTFVTSSLKVMAASEDNSKIGSHIAKDAASSDSGERFEVVASIILGISCSLKRYSSSMCKSINEMFSFVGGFDARMIMSYKDAACLYGVSEESSLKRICDAEKESAGVIEPVDEFVETDDEKEKKKKEDAKKKELKKAEKDSRSFVGRHKWIIISVCAVVFVGFAAFMFTL